MPAKPAVVVTGAGGFIGGRAVEILHASGLADVRAVIRRWSTAARIGRFPLDLIRADVTDAGTMSAVMAGADAVFHCARGDRHANVEGTRGVLQAALDAGVRKVVHLSTIEVYGDASGTVTEDAPLVKTGRPYGDSKIEAEDLCRQFAARGLSVTMLRPTVVYGPFSDLWTVEFAQRFQAGKFLPEDAGRGVCNLVYVDDVVGAMLSAWRTDGASGQAFNVNGPDRVTWNEYFEALNAAMGLPPLDREKPGAARRSAALMMPVRRAAKLALKHFQKPIMAVYQRSDLARRIMRGAEGAIKRTPTPAEFTLYNRTAWYDGSRAAAALGWKPAFDMSEGVALSAAWLKFHRYV